MGNWTSQEEEPTYDDSIFSSASIEYPAVQLPLDSEGYVKSFSIGQASTSFSFPLGTRSIFGSSFIPRLISPDNSLNSQVDEFKAFFQEYGFVIIDNVITEEENEATINEIWNHLESREWSIFGEGIKV
jgi:hypothetical protein